MLVPSNGRIVVEPVGQEDITTKGGILIPGQALESSKFVRGKVISTSEVRLQDGSFANSLVEVGNIVIYNVHNCAKVTDLAKEYHILPDYEVQAIVVK
jgi:co-chaperonin GroES (HSP10)